ncbi:MAG: hypothetical protein ACRCWR_04905, partial [Saezia sp.]
MCTIKFLIRQPWLYMAAGLLLLALMCFTIYDANSSRHIVPFEQLQSYTGKVVAVEPMSQGAGNTRYMLSAELSDGSKKQLSVTSNEPIPIGAQVQALMHQGKVYDLVVSQQRLIEYQNVIAQDVAKAQSAKAMMVHPVSILFIIFLFGAGIALEVFKRRYPERYQKYCVCAFDRIKQMEREAA